MFHTKSRKEQLQDRSSSLADTAATVADQLRDRVAPAIGQAAENAKGWSQPHVEAARHWAKPRVEHGIEIAAPKLESAVSGIAPKVDVARDKIVDDLLPRVTEAITAWAAASAAAKDEAFSRGAGAAAVVTGDAVAKPKRKKRGRVLMILGALGAAGAAVAAFMRKSAPKDDPWSTPLEDRYVAPTTGRHSSLDPVAPVVPVDPPTVATPSKAATPKAATGGEAKPTESTHKDTDPDKNTHPDKDKDPLADSVTSPSDNSDKGHGA